MLSTPSKVPKRRLKLRLARRSSRTGSSIIDDLRAKAQEEAAVLLQLHMRQSKPSVSGNHISAEVGALAVELASKLLRILDDVARQSRVVDRFKDENSK